MKPLFELGPFLCDDLLDHTLWQCEYKDVKSKFYLNQNSQYGTNICEYDMGLLGPRVMTWMFPFDLTTLSL